MIKYKQKIHKIKSWRYKVRLSDRKNEDNESNKNWNEM